MEDRKQTLYFQHLRAEAQTIVFHDYTYMLPPEAAKEPNHYLSSIVQDFLTLLVFRLLFC